MEQELHSIKVNLNQNYLTDNPDDLMARVISERTLGIGEICKIAVTRGGAPTTPQAMEHNATLFLREMAYQLMDGYAINTGYFTANAQVRATFSHRNEKFDPQKHSILFRFNQGELLRKEIPNINVQVMGMGDSNIIVSHVVDSKTGSVNDLLTPHGTLKIKGGRLKLAGENPQVGVYFEDDAGMQTRVETCDVITNNPSELIVQIPALAAGTYKLVICTQYAVSTLLKEPRTAAFEKQLTVNSPDKV